MKLLDCVGESEASEPTTWPSFDDGIPDMLLSFATCEIVVEAKTGTAEHPTPSKKPQTISYERSDRSLVVFITPDRCEPANPRATPTTFATFALCLAKTLEAFELPSDTRAAYAMLFTHFLTCATECRKPARELLNQINRWAALPDWLDEDVVLDNLADLLMAKELLGLEPIS